MKNQKHKTFLKLTTQDWLITCGVLLSTLLFLLTSKPASGSELTPKLKAACFNEEPYLWLEKQPTNLTPFTPISADESANNRTRIEGRFYKSTHRYKHLSTTSKLWLEKDNIIMPPASLKDYYLRKIASHSYFALFTPTDRIEYNLAEVKNDLPCLVL
ncbi:MAG: hypothetical protein K0U41_02375 [Gammaproteobacteria bacterium]|nr:hypothetical protein [Gammaproteobacteria bacterium]